MRTLADRLGLTGPLGSPPEGRATSDSPSLVQLRERLHRRIAEAQDLPRLLTALRWFASFCAASPDRVPFVPAADDIRGQMWNAETLELFAEFIRSSAPRGKTRGDSVSADAISGYVSALRLYRSREARYPIAPGGLLETLRLVVTSMRKEDGPRGQRGRSLGVRAQTLAAAATVLDRASPDGAVEWAAAVIAHNAILRGGEVGVPDDADPDEARVITWRSIAWQTPRAESVGRPWLILRVVPIKDPKGSKAAYPIPVPRRHDGAFGADPLCPYDALALAWWLRAGPRGAPFPVTAEGRPEPGWEKRARPRQPGFPFFADAMGVPFNTSRVRDIARRVAVAGGMDATEVHTEVGAKAFRIGGATDWREESGDASAHIVRQRGRWDSDVAHIYQRPLLAAQLAMAAAVGNARGTDLESLCYGFAQRAVR